MRHKTGTSVLRLFLLAALAAPLLWPVRGAAGTNGHLRVDLTPSWTTGIISDGVGPSGIVVADLNQDSVTDIVACS